MMDYAVIIFRPQLIRFVAYPLYQHLDILISLSTCVPVVHTLAIQTDEALSSNRSEIWKRRSPSARLHPLTTTTNRERRAGENPKKSILPSQQQCVRHTSESE